MTLQELPLLYYQITTNNSTCNRNLASVLNNQNDCSRKFSGASKAVHIFSQSIKVINMIKDKNH